MIIYPSCEFVLGRKIVSCENCYKFHVCLAVCTKDRNVPDICVENKTDGLVRLKTIGEQIRDCLEEEVHLQSRLAVLETNYITSKNEIEKKLLGLVEKRKQLQLEKGKGADPWKA